MFSKIDAYDAETKLADLLRQAREGHRFTITHRGKPVADLAPSGSAPASDAAPAIEGMLIFKRIVNIDPADVADWIVDGRR